MVLDAIGFALEKVLAGVIPMPGQEIRIVLALIGLLVATYYDIFNRRNIPDKPLYVFFLLAVIANAVFFEPSLVIYGAVIAIFLGLFGYWLYRTGQWGGADAIIVVSIALLVPIHPTFSMVSPNYPFVLSMFVFAFTLFAIYSIVKFSVQLQQSKRTKADKKYLILLIPYAILMYILFTLPIAFLISPMYIVVLSLTILASVFYLVYRKPIRDQLSQKVKLKDVEDGDVVVLEKMEKEYVWKYKIPRLITLQELKRLKKLKIASLWIYTHLPPFIPFLLVGFVLSLFFSALLI
jgi:hypothetical protein